MRVLVRPVLLSLVWMKNLYNGDKAIVLYNNGSSTIDVSVTWSLVGWTDTDNVSIRDLWARHTVGVFQHGYNATVASHDVFFFRATKH